MIPNEESVSIIGQLYARFRKFIGGECKQRHILCYRIVCIYRSRRVLSYLGNLIDYVANFNNHLLEEQWMNYEKEEYMFLL